MPEKQNDPARGVSRRAFTRGVAIAAAGTVVLPGFSEGQQVPPPSGAAPVTTSEKKPPEAASAEKKLLPAEEAELEAKFNRIVNVYGSRLAPEQKEEVRRQLGDQVKAVESIRAAAVDNSTQPATVLRIAGKV